MTETQILIVEDEIIIAEDIRRTLQKLGYVIPSVFSSGEEAIKEIEKNKPDLVLMDIFLKGEMDGIETAEQINSRFNIPVVYLTAFSDEKILERAKATAPFGYIIKPIKRRELQITVDMALYKHRMEKKLKKSKDFSETVLNSMNDAISVVDVNDFKIIEVNTVFLDTYGLRREDTIGRNCYEITHKRVEPCEPPFDTCPLADTLNTGKHSTAEHVHFASNGKKQYVEITASPIKDETGKVISIIHVTRDITQRKQAEEKLAELLEELKRSNSELEQFAYIASHDLQEPLRMVTGYVQLLERRYKGKLDPDADDFIVFAVDGAKRMQNMINELLQYSRVTTRGKPLERIDCNALLDMVITNLKIAIDESSAIITHDPLPTVFADASQIERVFQNLIGNALKFRGENPPRIHIMAEKKENEWIFSVKDNGIGFDMKQADRLFKMFQRLQGGARYPGTGMGLAICKKIVERHGGRIWAESESGKGSTFYFTIPKNEGEQEK